MAGACRTIRTFRPELTVRGVDDTEDRLNAGGKRLPPGPKVAESRVARSRRTGHVRERSPPPPAQGSYTGAGDYGARRGAVVEKGVTPSSIGRSRAPSLSEHPAGRGARCRCGTRISAGDPAFELTGLSGEGATLFGNRSFCSALCVRAEILEAFETLDAMAGASPQEMVADLEETYLGLRRDLVALLTARAFPSAS